MSKVLNVVAVSGSYKLPSRTTGLIEAIVSQLRVYLDIDFTLIELSDIGSSLLASYDRNALPVSVKNDLELIEGADFLIVATPVYRASYTGLFKHLFDFIDQDSLIDVPVLLAATGGTARHALMIEHQLRPLFSFFQAVTLPVGIYATESDFEFYKLKNPDIHQRIEYAVERALPFVKTNQKNWITLLQKTHG